MKGECNIFKSFAILCLLMMVSVVIAISQPLPKEIITIKENSWRSATVFTHVVWNDLLFYGGGSGSGGGDPRHEIEIGVFHLLAPDSGYHNERNPIITREQFDLDEPGKGITPLSIFERGDSLFMFCTSRPDDDLYPRIVLISAHRKDPFTWGNYRLIIDKMFSGKVNNHGASVITDPDNPENILVYFAALTPGEDYRILLATAPKNKISDPSSYLLLNYYNEAVLKHRDAKTNYPFVRYIQVSQKYELWYSGHTIFNSFTRSCFKTISSEKDNFKPAKKAVINPSGDVNRNDNAYATGPKIYGDDLYYSGRNRARGNYLSIFHINVNGCYKIYKKH